jgi:hypothetical protein
MYQAQVIFITTTFMLLMWEVRTASPSKKPSIRAVDERIFNWRETYKDEMCGVSNPEPFLGDL